MAIGRTSLVASVAACVAAFAAGLLLGSRLSAGKEKRRKRTMLQATVRPDRVALYRRHHSGVWPEVQEGLAAAGVETISIWADPNDQCRLFMYLEQAEDCDDLSAGSAYRAKPKVAEWEECMEKEFHAGWTPLDEWYTLKAAGSRCVQLSTNSLPPCYDILMGDGK
uniref:L-rhamnose mutarotase n=1 Tax=Pyrodinium bahamense TaxID=73915 RepID=A0A7S0FAL7_9DINO|mmetsp:Transcript_16352/g.45040  ORF Transcript_16352/g.45040 Transcript_16352/m.45040 type:complete len:166 (+) Transcript_16352:76-573(+)